MPSDQLTEPRLLGADEVAPASSVSEKQNGKRVNSANSVAIWLRDALAGGALPVTELDRRARASVLIGNEPIGQNKRFRRARRLLGVEAYQAGRRWFWVLPACPLTDELEPPPVASNYAAVEPVASGVPGISVEPLSESAAVTLTRASGAHATMYDLPVRTSDDHAAVAAVTSWAEGVANLNYSRPPRGVAAHRWHAIIADFRTFLSSI